MSEPQRTVIVVEDETDAADMFAEMMRVSGFRVIKSYAGGPVMSILQTEVPDLVILDVMMPDISGLTVLEFMRTDPRLAQVPVIVVSAKSMPADIKVGMDAGASAYLTKPVGFMDLKRAVEQVFGEKRQPAS